MSNAKDGAVAAPTTVEELPWFAKAVNHVMTPGSSLTTTVWTLFNCLIAMLFGVWLIFAFQFPDSIHVWIFLALGVGLAFSTNIFFREVFAAGHDFASTEAAKKEGAEGDAKPLEDKKRD